MSEPIKISSCRICGNPRLVEVLDLGRQALTGRFPRPGESDPTAGPLRLELCHGDDPAGHCGLLQLSHSYALEEMYGESYGYRSSISPAMVRHLGRLADKAVQIARPKPGDSVLDIGCNDGTLLEHYNGLGLRRFGVDPSIGKLVSAFPADIGALVDFFSALAVRATFGDRRYKIITSIAMFYDLDRPMGFMREVHDLLDRDGVWITEQAHMATMLRNMAFDSVCHEHLAYYNLHQIKWMADRCGFRLLDVELNNVNGASFNVVLTRSDSTVECVDPAAIDRLLQEERQAGFATLTPYRLFSDRIGLFRKRVRNFFQEARDAGETVLGYGASTKGNVVLQYCGITAEDMPAIAEKYPPKFGRETPGTRIPIVSEEQAHALHPDYLFVLPWHLRDEIIEREKRYLDAGGALVFPLPKFEIVRSRNRAVIPPLKEDSKIAWARPILFGDEANKMCEAMDSTFISDGPFIASFESAFAEYHSLPMSSAITVSNGTTAIELALRGLGIGAGDEVIVPGWAFGAAANMTLAVGARPVFADITEDTWLIDVEHVRRLISARTRAIVAVHTYGNVCDMEELRAISDQNDIVLIEDCAESLFSRYGGKPCGLLGHAATYSFQATKTITCGEGGMVLVSDDEAAERMRLIRNHGMTPARKYWHQLAGHNFRITNYAAAMLCAQWEHRNEVIEMRRRLFNGYRHRLKDVPGLRLQKFPDAVDPVPWGFGVLIDPMVYGISRDEVMRRLAEDGIECRPAFVPSTSQPIYAAPDLPIARYVGDHAFVPPISPYLTEQELDYVVERLFAVLGA